MTESDLVPEAQIDKHLEQHGTDDKQALKDFMTSEAGGKGIARCFPVSYLQGNFAYYYLDKNFKDKQM